MDRAVTHSRPESAGVQAKLMSPHWQRKSPSQIQQHLEDKHAAAAHRRSLQQVQKKARQARAQAGRQVILLKAMLVLHACSDIQVLPSSAVWGLPQVL